MTRLRGEGEHAHPITQAIRDNVMESLSGVKGDNSVKSSMVADAEIERLLARHQPEPARRGGRPETTESLGGLSARNRLHGFVEEVRVDGLLAQVRLRVGDQSLTAVITADAVHSLKLKRGDDAMAIVLAALSLAKLGLGRNVRAEQGALETRTVAASDVTASSARPVPLAKKDTLVYIIDGDSKYYHTCAHGSSDAQRQAVTITVAKARNLAPCPVCASKMQ